MSALGYIGESYCAWTRLCEFEIRDERCANTGREIVFMRECDNP